MSSRRSSSSNNSRISKRRAGAEVACSEVSTVAAATEGVAWVEVDVGEAEGHAGERNLGRGIKSLPMRRATLGWSAAPSRCYYHVDTSH